MSDLAAFQERFAAGLLSEAPPSSLGDEPCDADWAVRFAVYRNNVITALADAVVTNFPTVERLVGIAYMRAAAVAFVRAHPPREPALTLAGAGFADFLRGFAPAASLPYLPDVAAMDRACLEATFAAETPALDAAALGAWPAEDIAALAPGLAPSARLVASPYPAYSIWRANRHGDDAARVSLDAGGETALFWRTRWARTGTSVRHRRLEAGEAAFVRALAAGASLGAAGAAGSAADPSFDIAAAFGGLLAAGVLARPAAMGEQR